MNKKNKKILISSILLSSFLIMFGIAYAFFSYENFTSEEVLHTGTVRFNLFSDNEDIIFNGVFPETRLEAEAKTDNYIDFNVKAYNTFNKPMYYTISTIYGDLPNGLLEENRILDKHINIELIDLDNDEILFVTKYNDLNDTPIYSRIIIPTINEVTHNFRFRIWIDENTLISDTNPDKDYCASSYCDDLTKKIYSNLFTSIKIKVESSFEKVKPITSEYCFATSDQSNGTVGITGYNNDCGKELYIPSVINGKEVSTILGGSFYNNNIIKYVEIPNTVTQVASGSFNNAPNLEEVIIPSSVTTIGCAFAHCSNLKYVTLSEGLLVLETAAFNYCTSLEEIILPNSLTTLGSGVFYGCTALKEITIPSNVTSIGDGCFNYCSGLIKAEILSNNLTAGSSIFSNCDNLVYLETGYANFSAGNIPRNVEYVVLLDGTTEIGDYTFAGCASLKEIYIPDTVTSIGYGAFSGCNSLLSINIPGSVKTIGDNAFLGLSNVEKVTLNEGIESIGKYAFASLPKITNIVIPSTVTSLGNSAFAYCTNLTDVVINTNSITGSPLSVFSDCDNLLNVSTKDGSLGKNFFGTTSFTNIKLLYGATDIGYQEYYNNSNLVSIEIPYSVTSIGQEAFYNCTSLTSVNIPSSVTIISTNAFENCTGLEDIYVNWDYTYPSISTGVFDGITTSNVDLHYVSNSSSYYSSSSTFNVFNLVVNNDTPLSCFHFDWNVDGSNYTAKIKYYDPACGKDVVIPEKNGRYVIDGISDNIYGFKNIDSIVLPKSIKTIDTGAFSFSTVSSIVFNEGLVSIGNGAFSNCDRLTSISFPSSLKIIDHGAFNSCDNIETINFNEGLVSIGNSSFSQLVNLDSVTLPSSLESIGNYAFSNCTNLKSLTILTKKLSNTSSTSVFSSDSKIENLTIVDPSISKGFYSADFYNLKNVTILKGATKVADYLFSYCSRIENLEIEFGLKEIGNYSFIHLSNITELNLPCSINKIGNYAFGYLFDLTTLTIPHSVKEIGEYAFINCSYLSDIDFDYGIRVIGNNCFDGCYRFYDIVLPDSVKVIKDKAFYHTSIRNLYLPRNLEKIGHKVVNSLSSLNIYADFNRLDKISYEDNSFYKLGNPDLCIKPGKVSMYENYYLFKGFNISEFYI